MRFFKTLDHENFLSGYAEMIKHGLISNNEVWNHILDFDLEDVFAEILVFDYRKSNDKNPEKVLTMDRININDLHLNYSMDDILLNQSNLDKTRITINGVDFSEQTQFYVEFKQTEHGYKSVLHYRNLEPNTVYVVEIDYFYEGGK